jgi:cytochrome c553
MSDWYLLAQLGAFRVGRRGGDEVGAPMRAMALALAGEAAMRDVVAYVAQLGLAASAAPPQDRPATAAVLQADCPACEG